LIGSNSGPIGHEWPRPLPFRLVHAVCVCCFFISNSGTPPAGFQNCIVELVFIQIAFNFEVAKSTCLFKIESTMQMYAPGN
jgi:hypothetical protein